MANFMSKVKSHLKKEVCGTEDVMAELTNKIIPLSKKLESELYVFIQNLEKTHWGESKEWYDLKQNLKSQLTHVKDLNKKWKVKKDGIAKEESTEDKYKTTLV